MGAAEAGTYKKNHPDEGIREMCDYCTSCTARLPWLWITRSGAAKGLQQPGRFPHSPEEKMEFEVGLSGKSYKRP